MLSTKARPITRHDYALIPFGAPNCQLIADTPAATYKSQQRFSSPLLPGLTIELAAVFASWPGPPPCR